MSSYSALIRLICPEVSKPWITLQFGGLQKHSASRILKGNYATILYSRIKGRILFAKDGALFGYVSYIFDINVLWPKHSFCVNKEEVSVSTSTVFKALLLVFSGQKRSRFSLHFWFSSKERQGPLGLELLSYGLAISLKKELHSGFHLFRTANRELFATAFVWISHRF